MTNGHPLHNSSRIMRMNSFVWGGQRRQFSSEMSTNRSMNRAYFMLKRQKTVFEKHRIHDRRLRPHCLRESSCDHTLLRLLHSLVGARGNGIQRTVESTPSQAMQFSSPYFFSTPDMFPWNRFGCTILRIAQLLVRHWHEFTI